MPYLGNVPAEAYTNTVKDSFNGDASTTAFTLSQPSTTNNLRVVVENVIQDPTVAYTVSGTTLTFTSAPPVGTSNIYAVHLGPATMTAVPPSEINNATTYTSDLTVQGAFTSQGIDDNADATAMTIDSSEIVMVGKTTAGFANVGQEFRPTAYAAFTRDGGTTALFNRKTSDGTLVEYMKDGTTVGSIGTQNTHLTIGKNDTGIKFQDGVDGVHPWDLTSNAARDAAIDLGYSVNRFRNLYLSGGVYLGGTGSSNLLDDYEEGTWTPTAKSGMSGFSLQSATYVKIGRSVTVMMYATNPTSKTSSHAQIGGLPFTTASLHYSTGSLETNTTGHMGIVRTNNSNTYVSFFYPNATSSVRVSMPGTDVGTHIIFSITYQTS